MVYDDLEYENPSLLAGGLIMFLGTLGLTTSLIVVSMIIYVNGGRNTFVPLVFLFAVTGFQVSALSGFHWRFIATEYPRWFCISQAVSINFFETVIVGLALAFSLSTLMAVRSADVTNIRSPFQFHPKTSPLVFVFPICSFGAWAAVVFGKYGSDVIGPSYLICDAMNPPYIKLLTYGAANLLAVVPAAYASGMAAWELTKLRPPGGGRPTSMTVSGIIPCDGPKSPRSPEIENTGMKVNFVQHSTIDITPEKSPRSMTTGSTFSSPTSPTSTTFPPSPDVQGGANPTRSTVPSITQYILAVQGKDEMEFGGVVVKAKRSTDFVGGAVSMTSDGGYGRGAGRGSSEDFGTKSIRLNQVGEGGVGALPTSSQMSSQTHLVRNKGGVWDKFRVAVHFREPGRPQEQKVIQISFTPAIVRIVVFTLSLVILQSIAMISPMMGVVAGRQIPGFSSQTVSSMMIAYVPVGTWGLTPAVTGTTQEIWTWLKTRMFRRRQYRPSTESVDVPARRSVQI